MYKINLNFYLKNFIRNIYEKKNNLKNNDEAKELNINYLIKLIYITNILFILFNTMEIKKIRFLLECNDYYISICEISYNKILLMNNRIFLLGLRKKKILGIFFSRLYEKEKDIKNFFFKKIVIKKKNIFFSLKNILNLFFKTLF